MTSYSNSLQNGSILLRAPEPEDLDIMLAFENDPDIWDTSLTTGPYSRYQVKQYIASSANDLYIDQQLRLMIEHAQYGTVGMADITSFDARHNRAEIGILINSKWRRKGFGKEAVKLLESHCFGYLGIHQLYVFITIENTASLHLFESLGYEKAGHLKDWFRINNRYTDVLVMQKTNLNA